MTAPVLKALFRHVKWDTDRVVHFIPQDHRNLLVQAHDALSVLPSSEAPPSKYRLVALYLVDAEQEVIREDHSRDRQPGA